MRLFLLSKNIPFLPSHARGTLSEIEKEMARKRKWRRERIMDAVMWRPGCTNCVIHHTPFIVIYCRAKKKVLPIMPTTLSMHYNGFGYFICSVCYRDCYVPPPRFVDPIDRVVRKRSRPRRQRMSRGKSHAELCDLALGSFFVKGGVFSSD